MMKYTIEKLEDYIEDIKELSQLHYKESHPYKDIPLNASWDKFLALNSAGYLYVFIAKESDKLIGYAFYFLGHSLEYSDYKFATLSNIFIHPDNRGTGTRFILWCEKELKKMGADIVTHHVKAKNDYGVLLKRLGYDIMNIEYYKRLDK